ncbi:MAG: hypothetical protein ACREQ5_34365 [Candidatus Dormibacteria bacterium]
MERGAVLLAILSITLRPAFGAFGPNPISGLPASIVRFLPALIVAIIIVVIAAAVNPHLQRHGRPVHNKVLAHIASISIVALGAGCGLITPMRGRWETLLFHSGPTAERIDSTAHPGWEPGSMGP